MTLKNTLFNAANHEELDSSSVDIKFMKLAIKQAQKGEQAGEVPVGAIVVDKNGKIVSRATNLREVKKTAIGHAELIAVHRACKSLDSWRLLDCTLYVSLEPCFMCAGALSQARIKRVVFGARDPKGGALESLAELGQHPKLNHRFAVTGGVLADECSLLLKKFFKKRRKK